MKRNLKNLKPKHYEAIKKWLETSEEDHKCPWFFIHKNYECSQIYHLCKDIFPKSKNYRDEILICPCVQFSYKYVRRVAKEVIKNYERL